MVMVLCIKLYTTWDTYLFICYLKVTIQTAVLFCFSEPTINWGCLLQTELTKNDQLEMFL